MDPQTIHDVASGNNGSLEILPRRILQACVVAWLGFVFVPVVLIAQDAAQNQPDQATATQVPASPRATVHGVVRNAVTDEPLPRALVRIEGDATAGALTDGDGRFEIPGVPGGPQEFEVIKPGFLDATAEVAAEGMWENSHDYAHNVMVAAEMPDVVFTMAPTDAIHGQIQLSTGDPAQGIELTLLKQTIQSGRIVWQVASTAKTNSEGVYRFGGLADGLYAIYSDPAMDSEPATNLVEAGSAVNVARRGYVSQFYPEARDLAGAAKIQLSGGDQVEANVALTLEPFYAVTATVFLPGRRDRDELSDQQGMTFSAQVMDAQGHLLPYTAQYDQATRTVQSLLPDGNYTLAVTMAAPRRLTTHGGGLSSSMGAGPFAGAADFSVAGHAVPNLRLSLSAIRNNPIQVNVIRSGTSAAQSSSAQDGVFITLSQTGGWISDGMMNTYAEGTLNGPLDSAYLQPGSYWAHTSVADKRICEESLTAGGSSLAREALTLGLTGPTAPLNLTLRDDCGSLTLALPAGLAVPVAGEEPFYTVYAVPDFDSTVDVVPVTLRASTGGTFTLTGQKPGNYHIYTFEKPVVLAYRNPAALSALPNPGQAVTLAPGAQANLVLEVPEH